MRTSALALSILFLSSLGRAQTAQPTPGARHNLVLFITDGLRHDSVNPDDAPAIYQLRKRGVDFVNSHSLYPTFTTPNASAFATGHLLGDTGDFGNTLYVGRPLHSGASAPLTPFIENDGFLADLNQIFNGNYLEEETLMSRARRNGYSVATIGKLGPTAIQDIEEIRSVNGALQATLSPVLDDATGAKGVPLSDAVQEGMSEVGLKPAAPDRSNGQSEAKQNNGRSGTIAANWAQQQYFANVATEVILPGFRKAGKPWLLIFWSRDPDGSQHNQGDSLGRLEPGINGPTSRAAIHNADSNLWQITDYLKSNQLLDTTDIVTVADHGFSTISRREISASGKTTSSYAAARAYSDVKQGFLPPGFLAIDLAHALNKPLFDSDAALPPGNGAGQFYKQLQMRDRGDSDHPQSGNALIGGTGKLPTEPGITDAEIIIAANGGSDLIYLPQPELDGNKKLAATIADFLLRQDYVDGIFVRDDLGQLPGTLPMSAIGLMGATRLPKPAMIVNFKSFSMRAGLLSRVEIADTTLQQGQGMHGSFSRADTFNNMAAAGPDFKKGYVDRAPASNADIAVTVAHVLGWAPSESHGTLRGRVLSEALQNSPAAPEANLQIKSAREPGPGGVKTVLLYRKFQGQTYFEQGCLVKDLAHGAAIPCD